MKKLLVLSVLLSSFLFSCKKDEAPTQEQIVKNQLLGKWNQTQTSEEFPLGSAEVISPSSGVTYEFLENGNLIISISGSLTTYTWSNVDASTIKYTLAGSNDSFYTIVQVDATTLKLSFTADKNGVTGKKYKYFTKIP
jgi:hypothetical protein